jgi:hypothetical protein
MDVEQLKEILHRHALWIKIGMKPGNLIRITRLDDVPSIGIYLGPSKKFDEGRRSYEGRFVFSTGIIRDIDVEDNLVWRF